MKNRREARAGRSGWTPAGRSPTVWPFPRRVRCRAAVLSTSALQGTIREQIGLARLRVDENWNVPSDFVSGFAFRLLDRDHSETTVAGYNPAEGAITLTEPLPPGVAPGMAFEVRSPEEAPVLAARAGDTDAAPRALPPLAMRLATTRGTNALLTRSGAPTALFITRGFADLLEIGTQQRPDLFALAIRKPDVLYETVVEVPERIGAGRRGSGSAERRKAAGRSRGAAGARHHRGGGRASAQRPVSRPRARAGRFSAADRLRACLLFLGTGPVYQDSAPAPKRRLWMRISLPSSRGTFRACSLRCPPKARSML